DGRRAGELRPVKLTPGFLPPAEGSALIEMGATRVVCTATVQESVPPFLRGQGRGWVTAEYAMLPRSAGERIERERRGPGGRTHEIQRLVGRSLRAVMDLTALGERSLLIDCDVIPADGGAGGAGRAGCRPRRRGGGRGDAARGARGGGGRPAPPVGPEDPPEARAGDGDRRQAGGPPRAGGGGGPGEVARAAGLPGVHG